MVLHWPIEIQAFRLDGKEFNIKKFLQDPNLLYCSSEVDMILFLKLNPLRLTAIQKLLEMIGRVRLYPCVLVATALDSDINQTAGSGDHLST